MLNKQGKGKIEWTDYTWNPIKGRCKQGCDYCYMQRFYKRFKHDETVRLDEKTLNCKMPKKPSKIFVCSNHDLFGNWIPKNWILKIFNVILSNPNHIFQLLTKNPKRIEEFVIPENCWIGVTVESQNNIDRLGEIFRINPPNKLFISFEPLLSKIDVNLITFDWIIIGANSNRGAEKPPKIWASKLIAEARKWKIPIWVKDNYGYPKRIKESPKEENTHFACSVKSEVEE